MPCKSVKLTKISIMADSGEVHSTDVPQPSEGRRLTWLYVFALSTVAILSIGAQLLIQQQLHSGKNDSRVINIAGRQRMLSQRLVKTSLSLLVSENSEVSTELEELRITLNEWVKNHDGLRQGSAELALPGDNSSEVKELFSEIDTRYTQMRLAADQISKATLKNEETLDTSVAIIREHESAFLEGMDRIVSQYVVEAEAKVNRLRKLEYALLALTLAVLTAEGLFIFRPAVRHIENTVQSLGALTKKLASARDEAEEANLAKSRFLANVSHELRTPMTAVLGMTELAQQSISQEETGKHLSIIHEAGNSLLGLINDLIDIASIDANQISIQVAPYSPKTLLQRVGKMMQPYASDMGLSINIITDGIDDLSVVGDQNRLQQVLLNLVGNAIKCTEQGEVKLICSVVEERQGMIVLNWKVCDTGKGIAKEDQERIFEPFTQITPEQQGKGLGLSICKRIADTLNGNLEVDSKLGEGTCISLELELPLASDLKQVGVTTNQSKACDPLSVLLVEDTPLNQKLVQEFLNPLGHHLTIVSSGEQAISLYQDCEFDCLLIDLRLPGINGMDTLAELISIDKTHNKTTPPSICLTAQMQSVGNDSLGSFTACVTKPFTQSTLVNSIHQLTRRVNSNKLSSSEEMALDNELIETYLRYSSNQISDFKAAIDSNDSHRLKMLSHRLRSQVVYFNTEDLVAKLQTIEEKCHTKPISEFKPLLDEVTQELEELEEQLSSLPPESYCS